MMKRFPIPFLLLLCLALALSGCAGGDQTAPAGPEQPPAQETEEPPSEGETEPPPTSPPPTTEPAPPAEMEISSTAFVEGGTIPEQYSCFGANTSPALEWAGVPEEAVSLVLIFDDPDSQPPGFVHWIVYNIPPTTPGYAEDMPGGETLDDGAMQGSNDFAPFAGEGMVFPGGAAARLVGYDGPCPGGEHRYVFTLYALDTMLDLPPGETTAAVTAAMEGHVLAQAQLTGLYAPPE